MKSEERWIKNRRVDGLTIMVGIEGYVIIPGRGLSIDRCPCCDQEFPTNEFGLRAARLAADMLYPMAKPVGVEPR